ALLAAVRAHVDYQRQLGVIGYPRAARPAPARPAVPAAPARRVPAVGHAQTADLFTEPDVARAHSLDALRAAIRDCPRCQLAPHRTNLVYGVGNPHPRLGVIRGGAGAAEAAPGGP